MPDTIVPEGTPTNSMNSNGALRLTPNTEL